MSLYSMPMTIRSTQRLGQIALTLTRHGFGHFVGRLKLRRYIPWSGRFRRRPVPLPARPGEEPTVGQRLVALAEELGPTFVKLGQLLSSRPDIVPPDLMEDLRQLQDRVTPFPNEQAYAIIRQDFQQDVTKLFKKFEPIPLASGSIAQTYTAITHDNEKVVIKVRRPNIDQTVKLDMYLLERLAQSIEKHVPELRIHDPRNIVREFAKTLEREMDLLNEASVTDRLYDFFADNPDITIPRVRWDLTSSRVLTMSFVTGRKFHEILADPHAYIDKPRLAQTLVETFMQQILELGVFHADPHPGNLIIIPPAKLGLVDFGMAGQIDPHRRIAFLLLLTAGYYRYMDLMVDILSEMSAITTRTDTELLKRDLIILLDKIRALPLRQMNLNMVFNEIAALARDHHVILPRDFVLMGKSLVMVGGTALMLNPSMAPTEIVAGKVREAVWKLLGHENIKRETILAAWHGGMLLKDIPLQIRQFSRKLLRGELKTQLEIVHLDNLTQELDRSSNRISAALIVAAIIIGSSMIFNTQVGPHWYGIPLLGLTGYLVAGIMGLWLVIGILRSGKLS
jgi:ubiquinone biosynthesis protein